MNPPAKKNEAYQPTTVEQTANIITHGVSNNHTSEFIAGKFNFPMGSPRKYLFLPQMLLISQSDWLICRGN